MTDPPNFRDLEVCEECVFFYNRQLHVKGTKFWESICKCLKHEIELWGHTCTKVCDDFEVREC